MTFLIHHFVAVHASLTQKHPRKEQKNIAHVVKLKNSIFYKMMNSAFNLLFSKFFRVVSRFFHGITRFFLVFVFFDYIAPSKSVIPDDQGQYNVDRKASPQKIVSHQSFFLFESFNNFIRLISVTRHGKYQRCFR